MTDPMTRRARFLVTVTAFAITGALATTAAYGQMAMEDDAAYAEELWAQMSHASLVGPHAIGAVPYERQGQAHAETLVTLQAVLTVEDHTGIVIVKRSYNDGATRGEIISEPMANLANVTVMFQREPGYDPENDDWFWAMYLPDGSVGMMGDMAAAGRAESCIACHAGAPGEDYVFLHDGLAHMMMFIEDGAMMMDAEPMLEEGDAMMSDDEPMLEEGDAMMSDDEPMLEEGDAMMSDDEPMLEEGDAMMSDDEPMLEEGDAMMSDDEPMLEEGGGM